MLAISYFENRISVTSAYVACCKDAKFLHNFDSFGMACFVVTVQHMHGAKLNRSGTGYTVGGVEQESSSAWILSSQFPPAFHVNDI